MNVAEVQVGQRVQIPFGSGIVTVTSKRCVHVASGDTYFQYVYRNFSRPPVAEPLLDVSDTYEVVGTLDDGTEYRTVLADFVVLDEVS